jgi:mRNA interferase MazF
VSRPSRGEVWWCEDLDKRRPVVVLTRDAAIPVLRTITVAPVTSTVRNIPSQVHLDERDGLPRSCAVNLDGIVQVPAWSLTEQLARLDALRLRSVCQALHAALAC